MFQFHCKCAKVFPGTKTYTCPGTGHEGIWGGGAEV